MSGGGAATDSFVPGLPVAERLRRLVVDFAGESTLTCTFVPGGRYAGRPGIVSHLFCATCSQARHWHDVAAAIPRAALVEQLLAMGAAVTVEELRAALAALPGDALAQEDSHAGSRR